MKTTITELQIQNFKTLRAVRIDAKGNMIVVGGKNGAGKCLPENTLVCLWDGSRKKIRDVRETDVLVGLSRDKWELIPEHPLGMSTSGVQDVYRLQTQGGYEIIATENHRLMAPDEWKPLGEFSANQHLAIPLRLPSGDADIHPEFSVDEALLMGLLIGDGSLTKGMYLSAQNPEIAGLFTKIINRLWPELVVHHWGNRAHQVSKGKKKGRMGGRHLDFLEQTGLRDTKSHNKFIPEGIYRSGLTHIRACLAGLVMTDGWITCHGNLEYYTRSESLSKGVQSLFLRLGIPTTRRYRMIPPRPNATRRPFYVVRVVTRVGKLMVQQILMPHIVPSKIKDLPSHPADKRVWSRAYALPPYVADLFQDEGGKELQSWVRGRHALSRDRFLQAMQTCDVRSAKLSRFRSEDIGWDKIKEITLIGKRQTFDLQMPSEAFFANDFLVHNSSVLDSIAAVLGGKKLCPSSPIRKGQETATIRCKLQSDERYVVERKFYYSQAKPGEINSTASIKAEDGPLAPSPQAILNDLLGDGNLGFDPLAFTRMLPKQQADQLRTVVGLDFSELDEKRASLYSKRRDHNLLVKATRARVQEMPYYSDAKDDAVDMSGLGDELRAARETNIANLEAESELKLLKQSLSSYEHVLKGLALDFNRISQQIETAEKKRDNLIGKVKNDTEAFNALASVDTDALEKQLSEAANENSKIEANADRLAEAKSLAEQEEKSKAYTKRIDAIDAQKAKMIESADWPVDGLGFADDGVTYQGLPFENSSQAEKTRVAVAISFATHPDLPVAIIRDGSLLDMDSLSIVAELAEKHDAQVFIERVGHGQECSVLITDGEIGEIGSDGKIHPIADPTDAIQAERAAEDAAEEAADMIP